MMACLALIPSSYDKDTRSFSMQWDIHVELVVDVMPVKACVPRSRGSTAAQGAPIGHGG